MLVKKSINLIQACFIRESCLIDKNDPAATNPSHTALVEFKDDLVKLADETCDIVLQMKWVRRKNR